MKLEYLAHSEHLGEYLAHSGYSVNTPSCATLRELIEDFHDCYWGLELEGLFLSDTVPAAFIIWQLIVSTSDRSDFCSSPRRMDSTTKPTSPGWLLLHCVSWPLAWFKSSAQQKDRDGWPQGTLLACRGWTQAPSWGEWKAHLAMLQCFLLLLT